MLVVVICFLAMRMADPVVQVETVRGQKTAMVVASPLRTVMRLHWWTMMSVGAAGLLLVLRLIVCGPLMPRRIPVWKSLGWQGGGASTH